MKMPSMQEEEQEVAMIILTVLHVLLTAVTGVTVKKLQDMEALNQKKKMHAHLGGSAKELVQLKEETYGEVVAPLELLIPIQLGIAAELLNVEDKKRLQNLEIQAPLLVTGRQLMILATVFKGQLEDLPLP